MLICVREVCDYKGSAGVFRKADADRDFTFPQYRSIMKLNLFPLLCLTGLVPVANLQAVLHNYTLIKSLQPWPAAQNYCRTFYDDLATIVSSDDWVKIMALAKAEFIPRHTWVGLYNDVNSWRWSFNNVSLISTGFSKWYTWQPDNNNASEPCATIETGGYWRDFPCTDLKPFICYDGKYSGAARFVGVSDLRLSWPDAQAYCRHSHTDLASAISAADNRALANVASQQGCSWFGLYRDTWKWSDGTKVSKITWLPEQPNNFFQPENCVRFNNGPFSDERCTNTYYFFCHTVIPVRKKQVMKLQVLADDTVSDPALQFTILHLIKQKLKEHGLLFNSTVHLRVKNYKKSYPEF